MKNKFFSLNLVKHSRDLAFGRMMHSRILFLLLLSLVIGDSMSSEGHRHRKTLKARKKRSYVHGYGYDDSNRFYSPSKASTGHFINSLNDNDIDDPHAHVGGGGGGSNSLPPSGAANTNTYLRRNYQPIDFSRNNDFNNPHMPKGIPTTPPFYQAPHNQRPTQSNYPIRPNYEQPRVSSADRRYGSRSYHTEPQSFQVSHFQTYPMPTFVQGSPPFYIDHNDILLEPLPYVTNGHIHSPGCGHQHELDHDYGATVPFFVH